MPTHDETRITQKKITPPELARRWGVDIDTVYAWIRGGELRAINGAKRAGGRPRYLINEADIADFERRRAVQPPPPPQKRKKNRFNFEVIEFI